MNENERDAAAKKWCMETGNYKSMYVRDESKKLSVEEFPDPLGVAAFKAGYLQGIDDGERAQCRKCFNRGYEDGAALGEQDEDTCSSQQERQDD